MTGTTKKPSPALHRRRRCEPCGGEYISGEAFGGDRKGDGGSGATSNSGSGDQTWLLYSSSPIDLTHEISKISSSLFSGVIRIAILPNSNSNLEPVFDRFSSCYPVSGDASFTTPFCVEYRWEKKGWGDLLMLANPLHLRLLDNSSSKVLDEIKYQSIDGELVGVTGDSWVLKTDPVSVTWHSIKGIKEESFPEITEAVAKDVDGLDSSSITTNSSYFYGKLVARAARLALRDRCSCQIRPSLGKKI